WCDDPGTETAGGGKILARRELARIPLAFSHPAIVVAGIAWQRGHCVRPLHMAAPLSDHDRHLAFEIERLRSSRPNQRLQMADLRMQAPPLAISPVLPMT